MYRKLLCIAFITAVLGCDNNLETQPTDSLTPEQLLENPDNLDKTLVGAYSYFTFWLQGDLQTVTELLANQGDIAYRGFLPKFLEFERRQVTVSNPVIRVFWFDTYSTIYLCNLVLNNLDLEDDEDIRNRLEGEAKFLRGLHYFEMIRFYALPYEKGKNNSQPGLPLVFNGVTDLSEMTYPSRSSVADVYSQIIADLQDAFRLLPSDNGYRADRFAARAMLARVYLQQGNFVAARDAAHDVLMNSGHTLAPDLASAFNNDTDGPEDIFALQVTAQSGINWFNKYWATSAYGGYTRTADVTVEPPFFDLFDGPDDRANFFYEGAETTVSSKWQEQFANVPYIRVAEMHLIRAESNFREGSSLGLSPEDEINVLRNRSNADPITGITLEDILDERRRELAFEGHRFHDAKRLQEDIDGIPYNADRLVMPLPQDDIDTNPNLEQNPGYAN